MKPNQPQHGTQQTQGGAQRPGANQGTQQQPQKPWNNPNAAGQTGGLNRPNQGKTTINPKDKGTGTTGTGGRKF